MAPVNDLTMHSNLDGFEQPVIASPEQIRHAEQLRREIREAYLRRPQPVVSFWSIGAD